ncbi:MAG: UPF0147 family protein [Thermoproteota archaeon]
MKNESKEIENREKLSGAIADLDSVIHKTQGKKKMKTMLSEVIAMLNDEDSSMSIRAANAISSLEYVTQSPWLEPYQRISIWQAVSRLESIRE